MYFYQIVDSNHQIYTTRINKSYESMHRMIQYLFRGFDTSDIVQSFLTRECEKQENFHRFQI